MATKYFFNNKQVILPGAYATIKSAIDNPPTSANFGRVLVIDNGVGAGFGGGSGVDGELASGANSVYRFSRLSDYQDFLKGGIFWKAAQALFKPLVGQPGASEILHVRAASTTPAMMTFTATGGSSDGGSLKIKTRDEGIGSNGEITGSGSSAHLDKGYGFTIESGTKDTNKWVLKIWRGSWRGLYTDGIPFDEVLKENGVPKLVLQSPEFNNMQTLLDWGASPKFNERFYLDPTSAIAGSGTITSADTSTPGYTLATGGTESYSTTNLDLVLDVIQDIDYAILLSDQSGTDHNSAYSTKIFSHIREDAEFIKFMVIGGGFDEDEFNLSGGSVEIAGYFNSINAIVVHGGVKEASHSAPDGLRSWGSFIHSAYVAGRIAGLEPQVPPTNKAINIAGLVHPMTKLEKEQAVEAGVLCTNYNQYTQSFNIVQGVNSIQNNDFQINPDATSFSIQIMRIVSQLNRELVINANSELLADERGVNINTLSSGTLENWVKNYLQTRVATPEQDDLIVSYDNVIVTRDQDSYFVNYEVKVNGEITKVFFTGFLLQ